MSKIYIFILTVPIFVMLLFKLVTLYEYDTKQRYLKDIVDAAVQKVKITGIFTENDLEDFKNKINHIAQFDVKQNKNAILIKKCNEIEIIEDDRIEYAIEEQLNKGDVFSICIQSSNVSNFSRVHNRGISHDDKKNLYYRAKSECRVEYVP